MSQCPGPLPTTRAFLSEISGFPAGSKVRFLGCVSSYNTSTGHLTLEHNYPFTSGAIPSIFVDVTVLLGSLKATDLQVGAWLNVLGYVRERLSSRTTASSLNGTQSTASGTGRTIYVQAVMVFSADAVHLGEYERVLQDWEDADRRVKRPD
ncbi:hypothetical protein PABG_07474 [Paracoccidioides brasiliensis Pb03]|uniref:CST complex subunit Ten1 n=2 Tax=Paracoccidioides brasiliensis TaxID=121759 RepID=C1GMA1_PARBD|nr:uncharacterized protein PADG_08187 [Paracoccidioides brasiliensis Pb18]EEH17313.1 hypothetical protein PABG_07474 [Paracoccidioides brasiliensis Pb03]EEH43567.1 hypothetical protein PADG_08187 [Paracoccidioides brasiliensis Pb18]ODH34733.1 hypothetical protein ACO22_03054 [Paracoccidioides brasiliensis]